MSTENKDLQPVVPAPPKPERITIPIEISVMTGKTEDLTRAVSKLKKALYNFSLEDLKLLLDVIDKGGKHMGKLMTGRYKDGYNSGYKDAFADFISKRVRLQHFEGPEADFNDLYSVGYELGYKTRLAEMAVAA